MRRLAARGVPAGGKVTLRCKGRGCRFKRKAILARSAGTVALTKYFNFRRRGRKIVTRLRPRTKLTILVTKPGALGNWFQATMRKGRRPKTQHGCLAAGSSTSRVPCPS